MSDNKQNTGNADRSHVSTSEDYEVQYWREKFGVASEELQAAVKAVGSSSDTVGKYLKEHKK